MGRHLPAGQRVGIVTEVFDDIESAKQWLSGGNAERD
jgi:hypothetical protein